MVEAYKVPKSSLFSRILSVLIATLISVLIAEVTCRLIGYDFERQQQAVEAWPIFYRKPVVPVGEVFYRRSGPATWSGMPLSTGLKLAGGLDEAYVDEAAVTIAYDRQGFRNPEDLETWDIVVVGDSFVELGYLSSEDLFTTHLGRLLGSRVKNLGLSYTGPLAHTFYLNEYGKSPDTKHAILVFFEGNDLSDLGREERLLQRFEAEGERKYRDIVKQTSFLKAVYRFLHPPADKTSKRKRLIQNAFFESHNGEVPVSLIYAPPGEGQLNREQKASLDTALSEWIETASELGMTPWLVYMPAKRRVLDGRLRFMEGAPRAIVNWRPTNLPEFVRHLCEKNRIGFIDVTAALVGESQKGNLTYNPVWDSHLNRRGSLIVAQVIADELSAQIRDQAWEAGGVGDFNGDGDADILWRNKITGQFGAWLMVSGAFRSWLPMGTVSCATWEICGVGDFNGDGHADILWRKKTTGQLGAWLMVRGAFRSWLAMRTVPCATWEIAGVGDLNGDAHADVLWRNKITSQVGAWLMAGGAVSSCLRMGAVPYAAWEIGGVGDFNGDAEPDVLWRNKITGQVGAWLMVNGAFSRWLPMGTVPYATWEIGGVGDFNGDAHPDILWRNKITGQVSA